MVLLGCQKTLVWEPQRIICFGPHPRAKERPRPYSPRVRPSWSDRPSLASICSSTSTSVVMSMASP